MPSKDFAFMTMLEAIRQALLHERATSDLVSASAFRHLSTAEGEEIIKEQPEEEIGADDPPSD